MATKNLLILSDRQTIKNKLRLMMKILKWSSKFNSTNFVTKCHLIYTKNKLINLSPKPCFLGIIVIVFHMDRASVLLFFVKQENLNHQVQRTKVVAAIFSLRTATSLCQIRHLCINWPYDQILGQLNYESWNHVFKFFVPWKF